MNNKTHNESCSSDPSVLWCCCLMCGSYLVSFPDETNVPPDVPSYLSSQGTLSERQDVCIRVEASGGPQPNGHIVDTAGSRRSALCSGSRMFALAAVLHNDKRLAVREGLLSIRNNYSSRPNHCVDTQLFIICL